MGGKQAFCVQTPALLWARRETRGRVKAVLRLIGLFKRPKLKAQELQRRYHRGEDWNRLIFHHSYCMFKRYALRRKRPTSGLTRSNYSSPRWPLYFPKKITNKGRVLVTQLIRAQDRGTARLIPFCQLERLFWRHSFEVSARTRYWH